MKTMDNLPFLSQQPDHPGSEREERQQQQQAWGPAPKPDMLDSLKSNPMALVVIGIIIGAILMNMRPVIIKSA
jgi:hypothetical protein